jgi:hypothetical protein
VISSTTQSVARLSNIILLLAVKPGIRKGQFQSLQLVVGPCVVTQIDNWKEGGLTKHYTCSFSYP